MGTSPVVQNNGWSSPVAPFITYPVQNVAWGDSEPPPYQSRSMVPTGQTMLGPSAPRGAGPPAPAPAAVPVSAPPVPPTGPLPVQDWFNLLMKG